MSAKQRLELTWIGKGARPRLEPRILLVDNALSHQSKDSKYPDENRLIQGDNLLALKALEAEFSGKIRCVYIDPPYNTGSAFEQYDDGMEHSVWLSLMHPRIEIIRNLLTEDGSLWISIDDMINDLKPRLGIEFTATPQIERGQKTEVFKDIAFQYNLSDAMRDGFVKEPEVATRENFKKDRYDDDALERLKLEDGIRIHNQKKVDLELYARDQLLPIVKPFMLIIAKDTTHAARLMTLLESKAFCDGDYKGKVLQVDSKSTSGNKEEAEDIVEKLLTVERFDNPIEIVIHVNMLKEGWDVTNLYTIVPLRAANSKTLVEQSIGRGLRLPYGRRTGVTEVDTLTIVGHDRFQDIVNEAQSADCVMKKRYLPENGEIERKEVVTATSVIEAAITGSAPPAVFPLRGAPATAPPAPSTPLFATKAEQEAATVVYNTVKTIAGQLGSFKDLEQPEIQARLAREAGEIYRAGRQVTIDGVAPAVDMTAVTTTMVQQITKRIIEIPRVMVVPEGQVTGYRDFNLQAPTFRPQPIDDENLLLQNLNTNDRRVLEVDLLAIAEPRPEDYILNKLIDFEDVDYDQHSALINKLSSQMVTHIRGYLPDEKAVETVLRQNAREFARLIHAQMDTHYFEHAASYKAIIRPNMSILESTSHDGLQGQVSVDAVGINTTGIGFLKWQTVKYQIIN